MGESRPNIIFIFSDQQRYDTLGCNGQSLTITPNLDKLASEGVRFTKAFTCQPVCGPARACLQTGKYATTTNCYRNAIGLPLSEQTLAHHLKNHGYNTGYIGKWHLASTKGYSHEDIGPKCNYETSAIPFERRGGYDYWMASDVLEFTSHGYGGHVFNHNMEKVEFLKYRVDAITDYSLDFLAQQTTSQPFFLFISYIEPHHQNNHHTFEGPEGSKEEFKDFVVPEDLKGTRGDWRQNYPDYLGCCHSIEMNVGRIQSQLEKQGLAKNTIIIYTSDHGCHFKTRNMEYKRSCHDASIHIPLIMWGAGLPKGKVIENLVSLIDYPATILDFAQIPIPPSMEGHSIKKLLNTSENIIDWPNEVFIQISESQIGRSIRTEDWKYSVKHPFSIGWIEASSKLYMEDCLYDLKNDPNELNNLVKDPMYKTIREELKQRLLQYILTIEHKTPKIVPRMSKARRILFKIFNR